MKRLLDSQIREIRERRQMGESKQSLCLAFRISGGHLDRILNGTARLEAGGPITGGVIAESSRLEKDQVLSMTPEELAEYHLKTKDLAPVKTVYIPELERQLRGKEDWSIEGMRKRLAQGRVGETPTEVSPSGIPLPPDWMENYGGQDERRPNDPNELLDELMKK